MTTPWFALFLACVLPSVSPGFEAPLGGKGIVLELERTVVWEGRRSVLCFAAPEDRGAQAVSADPSVLSVLEEVQVLEGAATGSVAVLGVSVGETTLTIGERSLRVEVRPLVGEARLWDSDPMVVTPVQGSYVQDEFSVGVEWARPAEFSNVEPDGLQLCLLNGERLEPAQVTRIPGSPTLRARFDLDAQLLGSQSSALILRTVDGREVRTELQVTEGPVVAGGECEAVQVEPPEGLGGPRPRVGAEREASGGGYVVLPRNNVRWVAPVEIEEFGSYQLIVRARGQWAAGAYPSLAVSVDAAAPLHGSTRLVGSDWQRLPVGPPMELTPGEHHLVVRLLNDLQVGDRSDRELFLDAWELVRVEEEASSAAGMMMMTPEPDAAPRGPRGAGLWVGLDHPLDGLEMNGRLWVRGAVNWSGPARPAPTVELWIDGAPRFRQQGARPSFALDRAHLSVGEHELYLEASLPDGRVARTPVQRLTVPGSVADSEPRDWLRFSMLDDRWDAGVEAWLNGENEEARQRVLRPARAGEFTLELPEEIEGRFRVVLEARAGEASSPAKARAELDLGDGDPVSLGSCKVHGWWQLHELGIVELRPGAKSVRLSLEPNEDGPELRVRGLGLRGVRSQDDRLPPQVELLYPPSGHRAHQVDMAVVRAFDNSGLSKVDVLIDGRPQATYGHVPAGAGHLTAPLLLRGVEPGTHELRVRVEDSSGNRAESEAVTLVVEPQAPSEPGAYARAVRLLNRLAYGPDPGELAEVLVLGEERWLEGCLNDRTTGDATARGLADARNGDAIAYAADRLVLSHALRSDNPVRTRFVLWLENHFSTWGGKTGRPTEWGEHRQIARLGWAPFIEHLRQSATSAAMLVYLDQSNSYAGRINENYARELLELHTLGVDGGYTQEDVGELARLLAGLTVSQEAPADGSGVYQRRHVRFDAELSDGRARKLLERSFEEARPGQRFDRVQEVLEYLSRRPETARFVARKLAEHYVASPAPEDLVEALARSYAESGGDPRAMLRALVAHPRFWDAEERLADPLEYGLRLARTTGVPQVDWALRDFLQNSGMGLFDCVTPDGYPDEDQAWADTNGLMQRWKFVQRIPWATRRLVSNELRRYSGGDPLAWQLRVLDSISLRLTGDVLGEESQAAALEFFAADDTNTWQRVDNLCELVCRLPEANLE